MKKQRVKILPNVQRKRKPTEIELIPGLWIGLPLLRDIDSRVETLLMLDRLPKFDVEFASDGVWINGHNVIQTLIDCDRNT